MIIVDASVWIDFFRGIHTPHVQWFLDHEADPEISLTDLTLCEVLQGQQDPHKWMRMHHALIAFGVHTTGGVHLASEAASSYVFLRKRGVTVRNTVDCLLATFCLLNGHALLHNDRDFDPFEKHFGFRVIRPRRA